MSMLKIVPEAAPVTNATPGKSVLEVIFGNLAEMNFSTYV